MSALSVSSVSVSYGVLPAVKGVSLTLKEGECAAIVGANGAGKSTLMRFIAGAQQGAGSVELSGIVAPAEQAARARAGIGVVPEGRRLFASLSVKENIELGRNSPGWSLDHGSPGRYVSRPRQLYGSARDRAVGRTTTDGGDCTCPSREPIGVTVR